MYVGPIAGSYGSGTAVGFQNLPPVVIVKCQESGFGRMLTLAPRLRVGRVAEGGAVPAPAVGLESAARRHRADEREITGCFCERILRAVEAASDVRKAEWSEQPLIDAIALDRRQARIFRSDLAAV